MHKKLSYEIQPTTTTNLMNMNIELSVDDIVNLVLEMSIYRGNMKISSPASFISIIAALQLEMDQKSSECKMTSTRTF